MTKIKQSYNQWANSYDKVENKTRDLDKIATRLILQSYTFNKILELGCGTGKNTDWLAQKAKLVTAVDFSDEMLAKAKQKITDGNVEFLQQDIKKPWNLKYKYDLVTCNLVLEHIEKLEPVFLKASLALKTKGLFFICELHPYKQYTGSKARFKSKNGTIVLDCFNHHTSEFFNAAFNNGFSCIGLNEWFDKDNRTEQPRLISFLFQKK